jgi:hypothetical protein
MLRDVELEVASRDLVGKGIVVHTEADPTSPVRARAAAARPRAARPERQIRYGDVVVVPAAPQARASRTEKRGMILGAPPAARTRRALDEAGLFAERAHAHTTVEDTTRPIRRGFAFRTSYATVARTMRLYGAKVSPLAQEVVRSLVTGKDIETDAQREVIADVEAVLKSYLDTEKVVDEKTRDLLQRTGRGPTEFPRVRTQIAEHHGIKVGDDALDFLLDQVVEMLMHSNHVEEVFAEDLVLRRKMAPIFKRYMAADTELEAEVRAQLRHVKEGTAQWDVEYARVLESVKRKRGLS